MDYTLTIFLCAILGSLTNYLQWKKQKKEKAKPETLLLYTLLGFFIGLMILSYYPPPTTTSPHYPTLFLAFLYGFSGEYILGTLKTGAEKRWNRNI